MHSLLRRFKIKKDYEDILQLLRIKTWEVLRDKKYKNKYINKDTGKIVEVKLSTWLYKVLLDRLLDILKVEYGVEIKKIDKKISDLLIKRPNYNFLNPLLIGIPFIQIETHASENELKNRLDFELYYLNLNDKDKKLLDLMQNFNGNKKAIAKELKCSIRTLNRKLLKLKKDYKKYLINGGK